jgi:hypothetical protein
VFDFAFCVAVSFVITPHAEYHDVSVLLVPAILIAGTWRQGSVRWQQNPGLPKWRFVAREMDKLGVAAIAIVGMLILLVPPLLSALAFLLWTVSLGYLRVLSERKATLAPLESLGN